VRRPRRERDVVPDWFDRVLLVASWMIICVGLSTLVLALLDSYRPMLVMVVAFVPIGAGAAVILRVVPTAASPSKEASMAAIVAVVLAAASFLWYSYEPSEHLLIDRDAGSYVTTALWLSRTGSLEDRDPEGPFRGAEGLSYRSAAVYDTDRGLQFQFNHFTSSVAAVAYDVGGYRALFRTGALTGALGLLALYSVAAKVTRRPSLALLVIFAVGASLPYLVLVRDLYSEPFLLLVLWSGAVLAERWWTRSAGARSDLLSSRWWSDPLRAGAVLLGIWFGTTVVVRAESFLYLAALVPLLTVAGMVRSGATPERWRSNVSWVALGATGPIALGTFDFLFRSGEYVEIIGARVAMSAGLFVVSSVASIGLLLAWKRLKTIRTQFTSAWSSAATVAGAAMSTVVGLLWLVRPLLPPQRVSTELWGVIAEVQRHEGLPIDLHRIYSACQLSRSESSGSGCSPHDFFVLNWALPARWSWCRSPPADSSTSLRPTSCRTSCGRHGAWSRWCYPCWSLRLPAPSPGF
jgi:hypothetical protein